MIQSLIEAGMSVARINTSHSSLSFHRETIATVREVSKEMGVPIGILADLPGPKYRLDVLDDAGIKTSDGSEIRLSGDPLNSPDGVLTVLPPGLHNDVLPGDPILIADGVVALEAVSVDGSLVTAKVTTAGLIESRKAVAVPAKTSTLPYLTEDTEVALEFAVDENVDFIGLSYIRSEDDVMVAREYVDQRGSDAQLVSKIELREALDCLDEVIAASDGLMVARGDLGVELPMAQVPGAQKLIIRKSNEAGKPVITATQMLESMINSPVPTRAEINDIHNAVVDGSDAIMLSGETSIGDHPIEAVKIMAEAAREAEKFIDRDALESRWESLEKSVDRAMAYTACWTSANQGARAIIAFTESGGTAARVSSFRPEAPIIALYHQPVAAQRLSLRWGVTPIQVGSYNSVQWMFHQASKTAVENGYGGDGDSVVVVAGMPVGASGNTNLVRVISLPEPKPAFGQDNFDEIVRQDG